MVTAVADTHAALWYLFNDERLSIKARNFIETAAREGNQIAVSSISFIEMVHLIEKGRVLSTSLSRVAANVEAADIVFAEVPVNLYIARALSRVNAVQVPDMPDRIIAATAVHLNVPVISRDGRIRLSNLATIW